MTAMPGTLQDLLDQLAAKLERDAARSAEQRLDQPVSLTRGRLLQTVGNLHLYEFFLSSDAILGADLSVTLLLSEEAEPTEGIVLCQDGVGLSSRPSMPLVMSYLARRWCRTSAD